MGNEIFASAGTEATSPATCIGGRFARIGGNGRTTIGFPAGSSGRAATGATFGISCTGGGGAGAGVCAAAFGGAAWDGIWNGIRAGAAAGGAAGGTGGPLEAGTRGNADPPVPIGKDFSGGFSAGAVGVTEVMRAIDPSRLGSVSIRGGEIVRLVGGGTGSFTAGGCWTGSLTAGGGWIGGLAGGGRTASTE